MTRVDRVELISKIWDRIFEEGFRGDEALIVLHRRLKNIDKLESIRRASMINGAFMVIRLMTNCHYRRKDTQDTPSFGGQLSHPVAKNYPLTSFRDADVVATAIGNIG